MNVEAIHVSRARIVFAWLLQRTVIAVAGRLHYSQANVRKKRSHMVSTVDLLRHAT